MHKNIRRTLAASQETESAQPVEPFDLRPLEAARGGDADMGSRRQHLRRMDRGGFVHRNDSERLIAPGALDAFADDPRALISRLIAVPPQHRHMQEHVRRSIVRYDEPIAL